MQVPVHDVESVRVPGVVPGHVPPALAAVRVGEPVADPRQGPVNPHLLGPDSLLSLLYNHVSCYPAGHQPLAEGVGVRPRVLDHALHHRHRLAGVLDCYYVLLCVMC